ncbi:MAG: ribonuclease P protein component [Candidatus Saccharibacteria bacterium]
MISRKNRFHGHGSLRFVYQNGKVVRSSFGSLKYIRNSRRHEYRLAVVVSRKVNKSAVVRNRIRRRIYEYARQYEADIIEPYDIVYVVYSDQLATMDAEELRQRVHGKLVEAGIIPANTVVSPGTHAIVNSKEL